MIATQVNERRKLMVLNSYFNCILPLQHIVSFLFPMVGPPQLFWKDWYSPEKKEVLHLPAAVVFPLGQFMCTSNIYTIHKIFSKQVFVIQVGLALTLKRFISSQYGQL